MSHILDIIYIIYFNNYSLKHTHMNSKNKELNGAFSIKSDMQNMAKMLTSMTNLQNNMKKKMIAQQQQTQRRIITKTIKSHQLKQQIKKFRQSFQSFSDECKNQWITVYQQLLSIINNIVEVYQIKIGKLESIIQDQQQKIEEISKKNSPKFIQSEKLFTQNNENQYDFKPLTESSQELQLSNSKKIKISDVIASYQSSILSSQAINLEEIEANQMSVCFDRHNKSICEKSFTKGNENTIQHDGYGKFYRKGQADNSQLSLSGSLSKYNSKCDPKMFNCSLEEKENAPSFVSSCRKLSEFQDSRRDQSKSVRPKNREQTQALSASKLSDLRKYLYNRKRM